MRIVTSWHSLSTLATMYLPETDVQLSLADGVVDVSPEAFPNVTKGITDVLELCETAGLDQHGIGCGLSVILPVDIEADDIDCVCLDPCRCDTSRYCRYRRTCDPW
jgi:hypothetical protein